MKMREGFWYKGITAAGKYTCYIFKTEDEVSAYGIGLLGSWTDSFNISNAITGEIKWSIADQKEVDAKLLAMSKQVYFPLKYGQKVAFVREEGIEFRRFFGDVVNPEATVIRPATTTEIKDHYEYVK